MRVVGRRGELAAVHDAVRRVTGGHGGVLSIEGAAGAGKTTLLDEVPGLAAGAGAAIARVGLTPVEQPIAWAGLAALLDALPIGDRALAPALRRAVGREPGSVEPGEVAFGLAREVERCCAGGPLVLVVDDVQWLDASSSGALTTVVRSVTRIPLLVVVACRSGEPSALDLPRVVPGSARREVVLGGLSRGETASLVQEVCGRVLDRATLTRVHEETAGIPLHVVEVGRRLATGTADPVPGGLAASLAGRVAAVGPTCADVLLTAALSAEPSLTLLAAAHPGVVVERVGDEAERHQVATVTTGARPVLRFRHPLLRAAAAERVGAIERAQRHRLLAGLVGDPQERALHLAAGAIEPDEAVAADLAALGATLLERAATAEAAAAFHRAAELSPDPRLAEQRGLAAGTALIRAGDYVGAVAVLRPLADTAADPAVRTSAAVQVVLPAAHALGLDAAADACERALALVGDAAMQGQLLRWMVRLRQFSDATAALVTAERAVTMAGDDPHLRAAAVAVVANARAFAGLPVDLADITAAATEWDAPINGDSPPAALAELGQWCDLPGTEEWLDRYGAAVVDSAGERRNVDGLRANHLMRTGHWGEAEALLLRVADDDAVASTANLPFQLADLAWLRAQRGADVGDLEATLRALAVDLPPLARVQVLSRLGGIGLAAGDVVNAATDLRAARALAVGMLLRSVRVLPFRLELVEALLAAGDTAAATLEAATLDHDAVRCGLPSARAEAAAAAAMVTAAGRRADGAAARFDDALAQYAALQLPFDEARVRLAAGIAARRHGKRAAAIAHLDAAAEAFRALGAAPWVDRAQAERDRAGDRPAADTGLTPTEQRVADLVAAGRSNAEIAAELFVSVRTVESNLTRIYRKLRLRSRVQLAAWLRDR